MEKNIIYYQFNATGNILIKKSTPHEQPLPHAVLVQFYETYLFCAAMLKAISNTPHPSGNANYSIYNHHALEKIIQQSKRFFKLSSSNHVLNTDLVSNEFSQNLCKKLLDIPLHQADTPLLSKHLTQMGKEGIRMLQYGNAEEYKTGYILFTLEYINGISTVTAKVIYLDVNAHRHQLKKTICQRLFKCKSKWYIQADEYSFVL